MAIFGRLIMIGRVIPPGATPRNVDGTQMRQTLRQLRQLRTIATIRLLRDPQSLHYAGMVEPVQAVGVATALVRRYVALSQTTEQTDVELVIGEARQIYPEMWRHLDEARIALGERGTDCTAYDDLRRHELQSMGVDVDITVNEYYTKYGAKIYESYTKSASFDIEGAHRAFAAAKILKQLMPEVDWAARAREEERVIQEAGSLKAARLIGLAKVLGALLAVALVALAAFHFLSSAGEEAERNAPLPVARAETPKPAVEWHEPVKLNTRAQCDKARSRIAEHVAKDHDLVRDSKWSLICEGILIDNQPVAFAVSVHAKSKRGALVELRGVTSLDGMHDLKPFVPVPEGTTLQFVGDLDRDTSDELVFVGEKSLVITRVTKEGFVDIQGPAMPAGCSADADVSADTRDGHDGLRTLILTVPDEQTGSNCLSPGKHYFTLAGAKLQET
jgi:hypothetical protein